MDQSFCLKRRDSSRDCECFRLSGELFLQTRTTLALQTHPIYVRAMTLPQNIQDMIDDFEFLTDWEDRYMHVIDMGKHLTPMAPEEKTPETKVKGCVSQVWVVTETDGDTLNFRGDSDAYIVKGLVAVVLEIYSGRTAKDILALDAAEILGKLGLEEHLSPQRANGLKAMIGRIRAEATLH